MDSIKHAVASVKEKVTHHHKSEEDTLQGKTTEKLPSGSHEQHHKELPTHGHVHTDIDPPGAPGMIETPAPGVTGGAGMPGSTTGFNHYLPRI